MERDEDGEPILPEGMNVPPRLRDDSLITGMNVRRIENVAVSHRGYPMPGMEILLHTTGGDHTFLLTRGELSNMIRGLQDIVCDS